MEPFGDLVEHRFTETTTIGHHVFFAGKAMVSKQLLEQHKRNQAEEAKRKAIAEGQVGKTAGELIDEAPAGESEKELRQDGPTPEAWVRSGYKLENYPPVGYAAQPSEKDSKEK